MQHVTHVRETALCFLLVSLFIRMLLPRRMTNPEHPQDNSWFTLAKTRLPRLGVVLSRFFFYSGIYLLLDAVLV